MLTHSVGYSSDPMTGTIIQANRLLLLILSHDKGEKYSEHIELI